MADEGKPYDPQKDASAQEPLTANELRLVTRLLGDPFAFPMEFKAWLRGWLEEQFPRIGTLAVSAETGAAGAFVPPAGAMLDYGGDVAPGGYVLCDSAQYDKTSLVYQRLFNVIGYKFSFGVTSGNLFRVPGRQEAMSIMRGASAGMNTIGQTGGKKEQTVADLPPHAHGYGVIEGTAMGGENKVQVDGTDPVYNAAAANLVGAATGSAGGGAALGNMPPFLVVNVIISLGT